MMLGSQRGQPGAGLLYGGKIKLWEMENFDLILLDMTFGSCENKELFITERGVHSGRDMEVGGPPPLGFTVRVAEKQWMELITVD